jgi:hypothetical protein
VVFEQLTDSLGNLFRIQFLLLYTSG